MLWTIAISALAVDVVALVVTASVLHDARRDVKALRWLGLQRNGRHTAAAAEEWVARWRFVVVVLLGAATVMLTLVPILDGARRPPYGETVVAALLLLTAAQVVIMIMSLSQRRTRLRIIRQKKELNDGHGRAGEGRSGPAAGPRRG